MIRIEGGPDGSSIRMFDTETGDELPKIFSSCNIAITAGGLASMTLEIDGGILGLEVDLDPKTRTEVLRFAKSLRQQKRG